MPIKLGVVMDPLASIQPKKDSTLAMLLEAQARGWESYEIHLGDIRAENGRTYAKMRRVEVSTSLTDWLLILAKRMLLLLRLI